MSFENNHDIHPNPVTTVTQSQWNVGLLDCIRLDEFNRGDRITLCAKLSPDWQVLMDDGSEDLRVAQDDPVVVTDVDFDHAEVRVADLSPIGDEIISGNDRPYALTAEGWQGPAGGWETAVLIGFKTEDLVKAYFVKHDSLEHGINTLIKKIERNSPGGAEAKGENSPDTVDDRYF